MTDIEKQEKLPNEEQENSSQEMTTGIEREPRPQTSSNYESNPINTRREPYDPERKRQRLSNRPFFRKKFCKFCSRKKTINYKDIDTIRRFTTDQGKILPSRVTGNCAKCQRKMSKAIKRARSMAILPFTSHK